MPQTDKIKLLYEDLKSEYELGSINDFTSYLQDDNKRKKFFNEIVVPRYDVKSIDEFENVYGLKKKEPTPTTFGQDVSAKLNLKTPTPFTPSYGVKSQLGGTKPKKNIDYLNEIEGLYKQKVSTSQERLDYRRQLKDLEPKINELTSQVTALEAAYNDMNLPLQERNAAAQQLNVLTPQVQELSSTYDLAAKNYNSLIARDKRLATEIEQVEKQRQVKLDKDFSLAQGFVESLGQKFVETGAGLANMANRLTYVASISPEATDAIKAEVSKEIDKFRELGKTIITQEIPKEYKEGFFGGKMTPKKFMYLTNEAVASTIPTVTAGLVSGGTGSAVAGAGLMFQESKDVLKEAGLNDEQAEWGALGLSIPLGILEKYGADDIVKAIKTPAVKKLIASDIAKNLAGKTITKEVLFNQAKKSLGEVIVRDAAKLLGTGLKESGTEMLQGATLEAAKQVVQEMTGVDLDEQMSTEDYLKEQLVQRGEEGVGGLVGGIALGGGGQILSGDFGIRPQVTKSTYLRVLEFKNPEKYEEFVEDINEEIANGIITPQQGEEAIKKADAILEVDEQVPSTITNEALRASAVSLVLEKKELQESIKGKDEALVEPQKERLKEINEELIKIAKGETKTDEQGGIETPLDRGVDGIEEGVGMAVEPSEERVAGEDIQTEEILSPELKIETPSINISVPESPYNKSLRDLGYGDADIEKMTIEQKQNIAENKIEAPIVESSAKVDSVKENLKQERIAEMQKKLDEEIVSETVSELEPPVVEQTTADVGGVMPPNVSESLKDVESTAKALEGVDTQKIKKQLGIEANWDMVGEGDALSGKDPVLAYTQKKLPEWNRESQLGNINPKSKLTYDIARGEILAKGTKFETKTQDKTDIALAKDENGVTVGIVELDDNGGIKHIAVAPEFRGKGVADNLIKVLSENNPNIDLSKTKLRSKGFEKAFGDKIISEAYHADKAAGKETDLTRAVEELLGAKPLPSQSQELGEGDKSNLQGIADKVGKNFREVQNVYNKYGEGKPLSEITEEDYLAAEAKRQETKKEEEQPKKKGYTKAKRPTNTGTEEIINSDNVVQEVPKDEAPKEPTQKEFEETKKAFNEANKVLPDITEDTNSEDISKRVKSIIDAFINNSDEFDTRTKQELNDRLGRFYDQLSFDKLEQIGNEFINQLGGIEKAVLIASDGTKDIPPFVRTFVLGQAIINAKKEYKAAKTEAEQNRWLNEQIRYADLLDTTSRAYGQANAYIRKFYELDPIAVVRKVKRKVQERNDLIEPMANKKAVEIKRLIEDEQDFTEAINEAVTEALEGTKETIESLQKEIEALRKEIASKAGKKYKKYPINLGVTKDQVAAARKRIFGSTYSNPFLNPEFWKDALILAADAIQEGAVKINDFYDYMNTTLKGKYSEAYGELYQRAKGLAIEKGAKEGDFSTDEEVQEELNRIKSESDAKKIAKLTALRAKLSAKKEQDAPKILANKIITDANKELDNATTQKEKDAISKIIQVLAKKAKDATTASNKPKSQSLSDLITFVLSEANKGQEIWNEAQKEVFSTIDKDNTLSDEKKEELKDFLDNYRKTVFDVLLTRGQKDKIIKERLIGLGYAKQVGGKVVLSLDSIIAGLKTSQQAIDTLISKISEETGISEQDLEDLKQALKTRLDDIIVEKKKAKLDAYLKQNERYRAARLINNRTRRTRVQKLIELYNAGGLNNDAVKNTLAEELGIISFNEQDETWLNKKLQEADDAPSGAERERIEEEIQAYLETKDAGFGLKEIAERWRARLLSGFLTAIKNLGGFYDTGTMLLQQTIFSNIQSLRKQGSLDKNVFKVILDARKAALYTASDIFLNGGVDMGNAFSEITGTKEGTPRVRYIEYWKPLIQTKSWKNPIGLRNKLKESEKFIGRTMSFFDTVNQVLLQETKTYTYLKDMYIRSGYSAKEASKKAYEAMNAVSIAEATTQATNEFNKRGIILDMTKKSDRARFNRRVYEIVQQAREKEATIAGAKFANRYTYKSYDTGIMQPVAVTLSSVKHIFSRAGASIRNNAKNYGIDYKIADKVATSIEFLGDAFFMTYLPFIKGVANILEKGLELNPYYGLTKSAAYLGVGATASKDFKQEYYQRSGEYLFRAIMGLAVTTLLLSLADDEDEENKKLYGAGQEDYRKQAASKVLRPSNTIVIAGRKINLDYLGSYGISLKIDAALADLKRYDEEYSKLSGADKYQAQVMASLATILYSGYTQSIYEAIAPKREKTNLSLELKMKGAEVLTRAFIPFTNTSRQIYGMIDPQAKKPISMKEYMAKYSGVVAGWTLDRPNFDYRGRNFNTGQVYSSSPDAFISMFKETAPLADEIDVFIQNGTKGDFSFTTIRKGDEKYFVMDKETGKMREMTDYEYYDVCLAANKKFDEKVKEFYNKYKKGDFDSSELREIYNNIVSDPKLLKKEITSMNALAKKEAFEEKFGYIPQAVQENLINIE